MSPWKCRCGEGGGLRRTPPPPESWLPHQQQPYSLLEESGKSLADRGTLGEEGQGCTEAHLVQI